MHGGPKEGRLPQRPDLLVHRLFASSPAVIGTSIPLVPAWRGPRRGSTASTIMRACSPWNTPLARGGVVLGSSGCPTPCSRSCSPPLSANRRFAQPARMSDSTSSRTTTHEKAPATVDDDVEKQERGGFGTDAAADEPEPAPPSAGAKPALPPGRLAADDPLNPINWSTKKKIVRTVPRPLLQLSADLLLSSPLNLRSLSTLSSTSGCSRSRTRRRHTLRACPPSCAASTAARPSASSASPSPSWASRRALSSLGRRARSMGDALSTSRAAYCTAPSHSASPSLPPFPSSSFSASFWDFSGPPRSTTSQRP